jgi:hypothetical protein
MVAIEEVRDSLTVQITARGCPPRLAGTGGIALDIQPLSKIKPEARIRQADGILFASYATLRSGTGEKTRLQQLLEWLTPDFDGVILFDEAHAMGGVAGGEGRFGATKGSQQGIVGVELQNRLPRARVIYASATGASDVNNLAYAVRLGLWGEGTAFPDRIVHRPHPRRRHRRDGTGRPRIEGDGRLYGAGAFLCRRRI